MTAIEPLRLTDGRSMRLAGLRRQHAFAELSRTIPRQWAEFRALAPIPGRVEPVAYGAICGADEARQTLEYLCAVEVQSFDDVPASFGRMRVPAQHYAVFTHEGSVATLTATWQAAWNDWLPHSGYRSAHGPEFERYGPGFDPSTGRGDIEVWVAIEQANR